MDEERLCINCGLPLGERHPLAKLCLRPECLKSVQRKHNKNVNERKRKNAKLNPFSNLRIKSYELNELVHGRKVKRIHLATKILNRNLKKLRGKE